MLFKIGIAPYFLYWYIKNGMVNINAIKGNVIIANSMGILYISIFPQPYEFYYSFSTRNVNNFSGSSPSTAMSYIKSIIGIVTFLFFNNLYIDSSV